MIKIIEDSEIEDMIFENNYILIMCKKLTSKIIKKLARSKNKVGIYYRGNMVLDTINGKIKKLNRKIDKNEKRDYKLPIYLLQEKMLLGNIDYEVFYDFIQMKKFFYKYFGIILYWDVNKDTCIYEKTTQFDKLGSAIDKSGFEPIKQINVNEKIFKKIKLVPDLDETLNSFVDKVEVGRFYKEK